MMNSEELQTYLSNIEDYVFDDKKIVTCSWLAKTFGIHANISKQLLHMFFENNQKKNELCATYLVIGLPHNANTYQVLIVNDKDLEETEKSLKLISSKHIYSIQKCLELSDVNILYVAQKEGSNDAISKGVSSIDFNSNQRDDTLLAKLQFNALPNNSVQATGNIKKLKHQPLNKNESLEHTSDKDKQITCSEESKESVSKSENKAVIPSMFKKATGSIKKPPGKVAVNNKKAQGIGAFFSKGPLKQESESKTNPLHEKDTGNKESNSQVEAIPSALKENKSANINISDENKSNSKINEITNGSALETKNESPLKSKKESQSESKKVNSKTSKTSLKKKEEKKPGKKGLAKKVEKEQKKRKRLVVLSDSDSNNSSEGEEIMREPTPEPMPIEKPDDNDDMICGTPEPSSRKRKKKLVNKTYTSSDGYLVTEKVYVDASCSEGEESAPEKKFKDSTSVDDCLSKSSSTTDTKVKTSLPEEKKNSPKDKTSSPQKTKQASLMSFFKKK